MKTNVAVTTSLSILLLLLTTACGKAPTDTKQSPGEVDTAAARFSLPPSTIPFDGSAECKSLSSDWITSEPGLYGRMLGFRTANGAYLHLDYSALRMGENPAMTFTVETNKTCTYAVNVTSESLIFHNFVSCSEGSACDYCFYNAPPENTFSLVYDYSLSCNQLTVRDRYDGETVNYH